jgi:hypothetical protein
MFVPLNRQESNIVLVIFHSCWAKNGGAGAIA